MFLGKVWRTREFTEEVNNGRQTDVFEFFSPASVVLRAINDDQ